MDSIERTTAPVDSSQHFRAKESGKGGISPETAHVIGIHVSRVQATLARLELPDAANTVFQSSLTLITVQPSWRAASRDASAPVW